MGWRVDEGNCMEVKQKNRLWGIYTYRHSMQAESKRVGSSTTKGKNSRTGRDRKSSPKWNFGRGQLFPLWSLVQFFHLVKPKYLDAGTATWGNLFRKKKSYSNTWFSNYGRKIVQWFSLDLSPGQRFHLSGELKFLSLSFRFSRTLGFWTFWISDHSKQLLPPSLPFHTEAAGLY